MSVLLLLFVLSGQLYATQTESWIDDVIASQDDESPVLDSIELVFDSLLIPLQLGAGSQNLLATLPRERFRFQTSAAWNTPSDKSLTWQDTWLRTRLTTQSGRRLRTDLLAVRRAGDPQSFDELHLTVAGTHLRTGLEFTAGTFQLDWGLGILSSGAFGAARSFSHFRAVNSKVGKGIVPRATSGESSWLRGAVIERSFGSLRCTVLGNRREWNARTDAVPATLSGVLYPANESDTELRDKVNEQSFGAATRWDNGNLKLGALAQSSRFSPAVEYAGHNLYALSAYGSGAYFGVRTTAELARSGNNTAWSAILSRGTVQWRGAFYAMYADPGYFAPRSQSPFSFGQTFQNERIFGARFGLSRGPHDLSIDLRSEKSPGATATISPTRQSESVTAGWTYAASELVLFELRGRSGVRDDLVGDDIQQRRFESFRIEPSWIRIFVWSLRSEFHSFDLPSNHSAGQGYYFHFQAVLPNGKIRPGLRVASFDLDEMDDPVLIYEPSVSGTYPLENFFGSGSRVAGWISTDYAQWSMKLKAAWQYQENGSRVSEFAIALTLHQ